MEDAAKQETKKCHCVSGIGVLVIVLAWWHVGWGPVALTVLGAMLLIKDSIGQCCCTWSSKLKT
jgi:hypothetical protein